MINDRVVCEIVILNRFQTSLAEYTCMYRCPPEVEFYLYQLDHVLIIFSFSEYVCSQFSPSPGSLSSKENKSPDVKNPQKLLTSKQNTANISKQVRAEDGPDDLEVFQQYMSFSNADDGFDAVSDLMNCNTNGIAKEPEEAVPKNAQESPGKSKQQLTQQHVLLNF